MSFNKSDARILLTEDFSPEGVGLIFLIDLYSSGSIATEIVQPVLMVLIRFLNHEPLYDADGQLIVVPTAIDMCNEISKAITEELQTTAKAEEITTYINSVLQSFLNAMWNITSVDTLDNSVTKSIVLLLEVDRVINNNNGNTELTGIKFLPRSTIGHFIQRMITTLKLLHFDEYFLLFEAFVSYRETTRSLYLSLGGSVLQESNNDQENKAIIGKNETEDMDLFSTLRTKINTQLDYGMSIPSNLSEEDNEKLLSIPKYDLQVLLNKQISILESYGQKTPKMLRDIMQLLTSNNSSVHLIQNASFNNLQSYYYIRYLEFLHESNYQGSFQALHQYFDYMVSNNSKYFYHFALISRATLHQYYGEDEKALDAIEEAISVARENRDNSTLTYILSWLFNFMRNKPELWYQQKFYHNNNELHLLDFLVKKSKSVSLLLYSMSYHFEVLHIMNTGGVMSKYLQSLFKANYISINDNVPSFIKSMEMSSTVWNRIGEPHLSETYCDIASEFAKQIGENGYEVAIEIRKAYLVFSQGDVDKGVNMLEKLKDKTDKDLSLTRSLQIRRLIMLTKIDINKGRFKAADELMKTLVDDEIHDIELKTELVYLQAQVQMYVGNNSRALNITSSYLNYIESQPSQTRTNIYLVMRLSLLKCHIFSNSNHQTRAISTLVQQLQQAKKVGFISIIIEAILLLASILNSMGTYIDSYSIIKRKMVTILLTGDTELISLAYYELSRSCFNIMVKSECSVIGMSETELFNILLKYLNLGISGFKKTYNLLMLKKCFELEGQMADYRQSDDLRNHSLESLEKLNKKALREIDYQYLTNK